MASFFKKFICLSQRVLKYKKKNICKQIKKSLYAFKQASTEWLVKFDEVVTFFGFKENVVYQLE